MASEQEGLLARTRELAASGDLDSALDGYAELCAREPYDPDLWLERAGIAESAGRVEDAADILFHVADLFAQAGMAEAAELAERVLALVPGHEGAQQFLQMFEARRLGAVSLAGDAAADDEAPIADPSGSAIPLPSVDVPSGPVPAARAPAAGSGPVAHAPSTAGQEIGPAGNLERRDVGPDRRPDRHPTPDVRFENHRRPGSAPAGPEYLDADPAERQHLSARLAKLTSPLLDALDAQAVQDLVAACTVHRRRRHEAVFHQDDAGSSLYLVLEGTVEVERRDATSGTIRKLALLEPGAFFGEMALLAGVPRSATVRAATDVVLVKVSRHSVRELAERDDRLLATLTRFFRARLVGTLMATSPLFQPLSGAERRNLVTRFRLRRLPADQVVLRRGDPGDGLYLVLVGTLSAAVVDARGRSRTLGHIGPGDVFGEMSLLSGEPIMATIRTAEPVWLLRLPKSDFDRMVTEHPEMRDHLRIIAESRRAQNRKTLDLDRGR